MITTVGGTMVTIILVAYIQIRILARKKMVKEIWFSAILFIVGLVLAVLQSMNISIPNPLDAIAYVCQPLNRLFYPNG